MRAKKSLGQHFLKSEKALRAIIDTGKLTPNDTVLEIGPGTGTLTDKLLETGAKVIAIEKDDALFKLLKEKFAKEIKIGKLEIVHDDILNFDPTYYLLPTTYYKLIANIPYNITGAILKKFLSSNFQPQQMVLLVQKEVAKRIVAADNKESILSISVKVYGKPRYVETVKAGSFAPAPQVDSAIISIENISKNFFSSIDEEGFFKLLNAGFHSKRKKLSSNISQVVEKEKVLETFRKMGLGENIRAENVSIEGWETLSKALLS